MNMRDEVFDEFTAGLETVEPTVDQNDEAFCQWLFDVAGQAAGVVEAWDALPPEIQGAAKCDGIRKAVEELRGTIEGKPESKGDAG